ncbi:DUF4199 domain-containing protein [Bacteroides sp. 519]|uniref:DUF4199 domain-containing protein n=1 Tax=Bacteroides sp. 519 TaxID=2302937 RepID=UPI0013D1CC1F|nr:DUF4199 domain-containing protein [Bacteroides sp. 519]NDV59093.1 DUF4199 domain-containing protein [Bacteroides sp. 519]
MAENRINLQRHAMTFGTYMGVYWIIKFVFLPLGLANPFLLLLFFGLTVAVPFIGYRYAKVFRDKICEGSIGFLQSWLFMIFMYMFAALLTAVAHYIYFRFIDNGYVVGQMTDAINAYPTNMPGMEAYINQVKDGLDILRALSPIEITMQLLSSNFLYCSIISLVTAPFVMKKKN